MSISMFNTKKFLTDHWRDGDVLMTYLIQHRVQGIERAAVFKWYLRESLPHQWLAKLIALLQNDGVVVDMGKYCR